MREQKINELLKCESIYTISGKNIDRTKTELLLARDMFLGTDHGPLRVTFRTKKEAQRLLSFKQSELCQLRVLKITLNSLFKIKERIEL